MARALAVEERDVPAEGRAAYLAALATRREQAVSACAHFWVFEHATHPGRFLEFTEAATDDAVTHALAAAASPATSRWRGLEGYA